MTPALDNAARPLVSVAIPAFNYARYLPEAIESVLSQDYSALEVLVVDDGSTDDTPEVLARYAGRIRAFRQANAGQAMAINRAWQEARGEVLSYLNADDRLAPAAVSRAIAALRERPDAVMVYGDFDLIDANSGIIRHVKAPDFDYTRMVRRVECLPGPGVFLRRSAAALVGGWNPEFPQGLDFDFWLRLGLTGPFVHLRESLAALRVHPQATSFAAASPIASEETIRIMRAYFQRQDIPEYLRGFEDEAMSWAHLLAARKHMRALRLRAAIRSTARGAALHLPNLASIRAIRLLLNAAFQRPAYVLLSWHRNRRTNAGESESARKIN